MLLCFKTTTNHQPLSPPRDVQNQWQSVIKYMSCMSSGITTGLPPTTISAESRHMCHPTTYDTRYMTQRPPRSHHLCHHYLFHRFSINIVSLTSANDEIASFILLATIWLNKSVRPTVRLSVRPILSRTGFTRKGLDREGWPTLSARSKQFDRHVMVRMSDMLFCIYFVCHIRVYAI